MTIKNICTKLVLAIILFCFSNVIGKQLASLPVAKASQNSEKVGANNLQNEEETKTRRRRIKYEISQQLAEQHSIKINRTRGSGSRNQDLLAVNSSDTGEMTVIIIAPKQIGTTISSHPTFGLYFSHATNFKTFVALEERLNNHSSIIWRKNLTIDTPGIKTIALPPDFAGLEYGKEYRFSVTVENSSNRVEHIVPRVWVARIKLDPSVEDALNNTSSSDSKAILLANNGVWYETIELLLDNPDSDPALFNSLVTQEGLFELEKQ